MKSLRCFLRLVLVLLASIACQAQHQNVPRIEESACAYQADSGYKTHCGYLVVQENRQHPHGNILKLPFVYVASNNPEKRPDPVLYTGGGPGLSVLHAVTSIQRRALLKERDYIAMDQRGTHFAIPNLECEDSSKAVQQAYLNHQSTDEAVLQAVRACHEKLLRQGIDLAAYNTDESAADIEDLRRLLKIDSINLMGISYSGGLMMAVLQKYPRHIRSLILDSPLPEFVNIDEEELANFNEALTAVVHADDATLAPRFHSYLSSLGEKALTLSYQLRDGSKVKLHYGRLEILSVIHTKLEDYEGVQNLASTVRDMIDGRHERYIREYFDGVFAGGGSLSGMRLSVYCSDKMAYEDPSRIHRQETSMPWLAGFHVNDVYGAICHAWPVKPIAATTKKPFYSNVPALLGAGGLDDACRPVYNDMIHRYLPKSQRVLFPKRMHGPLLNSLEGDLYIAEFLSHPEQPIKSQKDSEVY